MHGMTIDRTAVLNFFVAAVAGALLCAIAQTGRAAEGSSPLPLPPPADLPVDFDQHIRPILQAKCSSCHGAEEAESGLRLDTRQAAMAGGDRGPAIVPGESRTSLLIRAVAGVEEDLRMPPEDEGTPLTAQQIGLLRAWIDQGARWPEAAASEGGHRVRGADHWAFQPIAAPPVPRIDDPWIRNDIDAFVLRRLDQQHVRPSPQADRATLVRRLYLDLIGLPPTPAEWSEAMTDSRTDWYDRLVDRLLDSPHYGERWARWWLDQAHYADSDGYEKDLPRPHAWRWREWVIGALNDDMPFDEFSIEQLAGDLLPDATVEQRVATGFQRNTLINREGGIDPEEDRVKRAVDRTNTLGAVWLGMTIECAHCHSHKYDPITQREYFQLYAFFNNEDEPDIPAPLPGSGKGQFGALAGGAGSAEAKRPEAKKQGATKDGAKQGDGKKDDGKKDDAPIKAQVIAERAERRATHIHLRGDFLSKGAAVEPGVPEVLPPLKPRGRRPDRLDLARWLFDPDHPLTARVTVNRIWQHYFGRGLVASDRDFGTQGEAPSHPELLDYLATRFRQEGWHLKSLHRWIVGSATYRQASAARPELLERDPYNRWLARQNRLRVEAEIVRDLALAASRLLVERVGGPSVRPPQPEGLAMLGYAGQVKWQTSDGPDQYRRGLYTFFQRTVPYPMLLTFDAPDSNVTCTRRERSNTPLQALTLWNDRVFVECAQALARRIVTEVPPGSDGVESSDALIGRRIEHAFLVSLARRPTPEDLADVRSLLEKERAAFAEHPSQADALIGPRSRPAGSDAADLAAWVVVARTLINLDEFITRE